MISEQVRSKTLSYRSNWKAFASDRLRVKMHDVLEQILDSVFENHNTAIKACHKATKTYSAAIATHCWLCTGKDRGVITTAPTEDLVTNLLWRDIRQIYDNVLVETGGSLYPRPPLNSEINIGPKWYAMGKVARAENAAYFQGFHCPGGVLYIIDEGAGVDQIFYDARERIAMGPEDRFLVMGNCPLDSEIYGSEFYRCFERSDFNCLTISAFDLVNVREKRTVIPGMLDYETVHRWRGEYGEDSPFWQARVMAQFLTAGSTGLIPLAWWELAVKRWHEMKAAGYTDKHKTMGCDVADGGGAESVKQKLEGRFAHWPEVFNGDVVSFAHNIERDCNGDNGYKPVVDANGIGAGTASTIRKDGYSVQAYKGSEGTDERDITGELRFSNVRSLAYWRIREAFDPRNHDAIGVPDHPKLKEDLVGLKYKEVTGGKIQIEPKLDVMKRLGRSPDYGDALVMANYGQHRGGKVARIESEKLSGRVHVPQYGDALERVYGG